MKKLIAWLLAILIVASSLPLQVLAAPETPPIPIGKSMTLHLEEKADWEEWGTVAVSVYVDKEMTGGFQSMKVKLDSGGALSLIRWEDGPLGSQFHQSTMTLTGTDGGAVEGNGLLGTFVFSPDPAFANQEFTLKLQVDSLVAADGKSAWCNGAGLTFLAVPPVGLRFAQDQGAVFTADGENTLNVRVEVLPAYASTDNLFWQSSDESVAKVAGDGSEAVITGIAAGEAVITVALMGDPQVSARFYVTVNCSHDYIEQADPFYLVSAATCSDPATYRKSCRFCGKAHPTEIFSDPSETFDPTRHVGESYLKDRREATCTQEGYTGDTVCSACGEIIIPGTTEPMRKHVPGDGWRAGAESHFIFCVVCGTVLEEEEHRGGAADCSHLAQCEVCGGAYGAFNPDKHGGDRRLEGVIEATVLKPGYTGDWVCVDCEQVVEQGSVIPCLDQEIDPALPQISLEQKKAERGEEFTVSVFVKNNPGFSSLSLKAVIPQEITLVKVENGSLIPGSAEEYRWQASENVPEDGVLMTFTFRTDENTPFGLYVLGFEVLSCTNDQGEDVALAMSRGEITVTGILWGDANDDGSIDGQDIILLKQYMAAFDYETGESTVTVGPGADANGDGTIDGQDIILLKQYMAAFDYETGESTVKLGPQN